MLSIYITHLILRNTNLVMSILQTHYFLAQLSDALLGRGAETFYHCINSKADML